VLRLHAGALAVVMSVPLLSGCSQERSKPQADAQKPNAPAPVRNDAEYPQDNSSAGRVHREDNKEARELVKALKAAKPIDRIKAAQELGKLGKRAKDAATPLCLAVVDPDPGVRRAALDALETVAPELQELVITLAMDGASLAVCEKIRGMGEAGVPAARLIREQVRLTSAAAISDNRSPVLPRTGRNAEPWYEECFGVLVQVLPDEETFRVIAATLDMDTSGLQASAYTKIQAEAIDSLANLGMSKNELRGPATQALLAVLRRPDPAPEPIHGSLHLATIRALKSFGPAARDALPALRKLKFDPLEHVRAAATDAIKTIAP